VRDLRSVLFHDEVKEIVFVNENFFAPISNDTALQQFFAPVKNKPPQRAH